MKARVMIRILFFLLLLQEGSLLMGQSSPQYILTERWGVNLSTRLDTISPLFCDSIGLNHRWYRVETDSNYRLSYFPRVHNQMLLFADSAGNVQNIAVKSYAFTYFNGNQNRYGHSSNRELHQPCIAIQNYPVGTQVTINQVECVDLTGQKMNITIPPFQLVRVK